jgi:predicted transcriptional regulator
MAEVPAPPTRNFSVRLPTGMIDALDQIAAEERRTRQSVITAAIELYLERRRVATEGAAQYLQTFDQATTKEMIADRALQAAVKAQTAEADFEDLLAPLAPKPPEGEEAE